MATLELNEDNRPVYNTVREQARRLRPTRRQRLAMAENRKPLRGPGGRFVKKAA